MYYNNYIVYTVIDRHEHYEWQFVRGREGGGRDYVLGGGEVGKGVVRVVDLYIAVFVMRS